jgi:general secretion pathway protein A
MYKEYFGFSEEPFEINPDSQFLYMAATHADAMFYMMAGIRDRKGITVVTGDVGTGKTTLAYALLKDLGDKIKTAFIYHAAVGFEDLLRNILQELGEEIVGDNLTSLIIQFQLYMRERMARDETVAIVIDEAQNLKVDVIEKLFRLFIREAPSARLIQILLLGQLELETKLDAIELQAFKGHITTRYRIDTLNEQECQKYIEHRLRVAGSNGLSIFEPEAIRMIWKFSQGIPRVINTLCDRALVNGFKACRKVIDGEIARETIRDETIYDRGYLRPKAVAFYRSPAFLCAVSVVVLAAALGITTGMVLKRYQSAVPPTPIAVVEKATPAQVEMRKKEQKATPAQVEMQKKEQLPAVEPGTVVTVKKDWTLSLMAQQYYGLVNPTVLDILLEHNPQIKDVNQIFADEQMKIPALKEEIFLDRDADGRYHIYLGTFEDQRSIQALRKHPLLQGKTFKTTPRKVSNDVLWYRTKVGGFSSREEALQTLRSLKQQGVLPAFAASAA